MYTLARCTRPASASVRLPRLLAATRKIHTPPARSPTPPSTLQHIHIRTSTPSSSAHPSYTPPLPRSMATISSTARVSAAPDPGLNHTSGHTAPVWLSTEPYSNFPTFPKLSTDIPAGTEKRPDVCIVGGGIAGISVAYEAVQRGLSVVMIEAREILSGESGRTSAHLASSLDDRYYELIKTFGEEGARKAFDSHQYALERIGEIAAAEGIECEYRQLPGKVIVSKSETAAEYDKENDLADEVAALQTLNIPYKYEEHGRVGEAYTGGVLEFQKQATFHPTKYLNGVLKALKERHPGRFKAYTQTRMEKYKDHGKDGVTVHTEGGHTINAANMVMTTNVPMHIASIILKEAYYRTYCIALAMPKDAHPDYLLYDNADPYVYVKKTAHPDPSKEYLIVGGEDHKVGQETTAGYGQHYDNLAAWARAHFPYVESKPEFAWSGHIVESNDNLAFIGRNTGSDVRTFVSTADSGNGLTHGVIAGKLITDLMIGTPNPWESLYSPSRLPKPRTLPEDLKENLKQNLTYKRWIQTDVSDIEEIPRCSGAVMHGGISKLGKPLAVYKDGEGKVTTFSAVCPHLHGIVAWNAAEGSWDCPVHGSRFDGGTGKCVMGPSIHGLAAEDGRAEEAQKGESG
ncbi:gamma-glutamylputrescine oxidoreductase [Geopyxis carbonaria]|nr:gamma-glutamylputrescine oxidoreductase [Geopyxis carbonaria]